jgi:UDP-3-O-[3-hydroxymyristoyl] glucosamine N-acyltransferase
MTIQEIRDYLGKFFDAVELVGNVDGPITGPAKIEIAEKGQVSFIANDKYIRFLGQTRASLVIVNSSLSLDGFTADTAFLKVSDPYSAFVFLLQKFVRPRTVSAKGIAPTAVIGEGVSIGDGSSIGDHTVIGARCTIGVNTVIGPNTVLMHDVTVGEESILHPGVICYDGTRIGRRALIHSGVVIGADGFGFAPQQDGSYVKIPQMGIVEIGDDVEIGANTTIDRATMGSTVIGNGVKIDNLVQIGHNCTIGDHTVIVSQVGISGSVTVGRRCMIGGQAGFAGHLELAEGIQVAAKAGITKSFLQPGTVLRGYPAQPMRDQLRLEASQRSVGTIKEKIELIEAELKELKKRF